MPLLFLLMQRDPGATTTHVAAELRRGPAASTLPSRIHAIVPVSRLHMPTLRALAFARPPARTTSTRSPSRRPRGDRALVAEWADARHPGAADGPDSPYRDITRPLLDYVATSGAISPRDVVAVFIPEYVVGHWWEQLLHNQSALRLKARLLFQPGVMVTSVPWQLTRAGRGDAEERWHRAGLR